MTIINEEAMSEYVAELTTLRREDDELEDLIRDAEKRRQEIKARVMDVASVLGGDEERAVLPLATGEAWDRRITVRGAGVDLKALEEVLGQAAYRRLVCLKTVTYEPSRDRLELARREGKINEDVIAQATTMGKTIPTLHKMAKKQLTRMKESEG